MTDSTSANSLASSYLVILLHAVHVHDSEMCGLIVSLHASLHFHVHF